jgi:streptogrisin C
MRELLRGTALAVGLSLAIVPTPVLGVDGPEDALQTGGDDEASLEEAIQFRETFGFPASQDIVERAHEDRATYSIEPFGVPLAKDEIEELFRRARTQTAMEEALSWARGSETFAGAYLDQRDGGRPVFMFTGDSTGYLEKLVPFFAADARVRVDSAKRTERDLTGLKDRIGVDLPELAASGIRVVRVAYSPHLNTLRIGVEGLTASAENVLRDRYGDGLVIFEDAVAHSDACDNPNNCRPMKGGIAISSSSASNAWNQCTSGWVVKRNDNNAKVIVTAGHCIQVHGGFDHAWYHNFNGFGRALRETFEAGSSGDADVGLISLFSDELAAMPTKNLMRRNNGSVTTVTALGSPMDGGQACRVGNTSGHDCGVITDPDTIRISEAPGVSDMTVLHTATWDKDSLGGDSGGPVFFCPGGGTCCGPVTALGTHVHSETGANANESWFSPQFWGSWDYTASWGYSYSICLTASC